jgi:hypothetical protein
VIPEARQLLERERRSRRLGSGLKRSDLVGSWRLERIWSKGSLRPATVSGAVLRGLGARLQLTAAEEAGDSGGLKLVNSVTLGALELRFEGTGRLQGRRPLLVFGFDRLLLRLAGRVLMERALPPGNPRRVPFFALIAVERSASSPGEPAAWMAARGRGGGLALWLLET